MKGIDLCATPSRLEKLSPLSILVHLGINAALVASSLFLVSVVNAQEFRAGEPIGSVNEAGERKLMSDNVKVYGAFHFSESCTFDSTRNLILAMNNGNPGDGTENDGFRLTNQSGWQRAYAKMDWGDARRPRTPPTFGQRHR